MQRWVLENQNTTYGIAPTAYPALVVDETQHQTGKLSIRGDLGRHWQGARKSLKFTSSKKVNSSRIFDFDLIIVEDKDFEYEALGLELARSLGLITPRWNFVNLVLNQQQQGIYLKLERFTPESFEVRGMPPGEIIRENNAWLDVISLGELSRYKDVYHNPSQHNPLAFRHEIYKTSFSNIYTPLAIARFGEFLSATKSGEWREFIAEVDAISWLILVSVMGSHHANLGDNIKWYYHPFERKFRPIPYDFLPQFINSNRCMPREFSKTNIWIKTWMQDQNFRKSLREMITHLQRANWPSTVIKEFYARPEIRYIARGRVKQRASVILNNANVLFNVATSVKCL